MEFSRPAKSGQVSVADRRRALAMVRKKRPRRRPGPSQTRILRRSLIYPIRKRSARRRASGPGAQKFRVMGCEAKEGLGWVGRQPEHGAQAATARSGRGPVDRGAGLDLLATTLSSREMFNSCRRCSIRVFLFSIWFRGTSPLTYRDRGRMGGMAVGIGWPPPGGDGLGPPSIGY